ncbi:MAG: nuclear transport factor 2 family protein [Rhodocyclaceae bacterium]|nr:nuclear transport factor 2 family protein [Rhodocyclaceae bacterium]MBK9625537.1 nuclear transport factor 2 family protein [Rhodocyclaceae bacterium]
MKKPNRKSLLMALTLSVLSTLSYANEPSEVTTAFHAALVKGDAAAASALLAPDITIYESGYVERSRAEYAGHHLPEDIAFAKKSTRRVLQHTERKDGNLAVIWEETETKATLKGKQVTIFGTETTLLQKTGDAWSIVHVHWSSRKSK